MAEPSRVGTREQILDTALELFTTQGYDATSLRQVADRLHLTKAAVYYHFHAKQLLLLEITRPMLDGMSRLVAELSATGRCEPPAVLTAYLDLFTEHLGVLGLLAREPATWNHPDIGQRVRMLVAVLQKQLAGPDPSPARSVRAACAVAVVNAVAALPADVLRDQHDTILAAALAALGEPTPAAAVQTVARSV